MTKFAKAMINSAIGVVAGLGIAVVCAAAAIVLVVLALFLLGCSSKNYHRQEFDPQGNKTAEVRIDIDNLILKTEADDLLVLVNGDTKLLMVGRFLEIPDANSVKAMAEGVVTGAGHVIGR